MLFFVDNNMVYSLNITNFYIKYNSFELKSKNHKTTIFCQISPNMVREGAISSNLTQIIFLW